MQIAQALQSAAGLALGSDPLRRSALPSYSSVLSYIAVIPGDGANICYTYRQDEPGVGT
jgi:hypothetical protein